MPVYSRDDPHNLSCSNVNVPGVDYDSLHGIDGPGLREERLIK